MKHLKKSNNRRAISFYLLLVLFLPVMAWGEDEGTVAGDFTVTGNTENFSWDDDKKVLTITGDIKVQNTDPNTPTGHTIKVTGGKKDNPITVTIAGININATIQSSENTVAMDVSDSFIIIELEKANSLKSKYIGAGLQKNGNTGSLIIESIDGTDNHSLKAEGNFGAGIGSGLSNNADNITINSGMIEAIGNAHSAGIGGGQSGSTSNITINGGCIIAKGSSGGKNCGIGAGIYGTDTNIHITGGYIEASAGIEMNGIGADNSTGIKISGGTIIVKGGAWTSSAYGIGGTPDITGGSIRLAPDASSGTKLMQTPPDNVISKEFTIDSNAELEGISFTDPAITYGIKDVIADENGKLYLYVPKDSEVKSLTYSGSKRFTVTFDEQNNGQKNTSFMAKLTEPDDPTRSYYTFEGWYTSIDYNKEDKITNWDIDVKDAMILYAKWSPNTFTFTEEKKEFTYGESVNWFNLGSLIQEEAGKSAGNKTFTITSGNLPEGLTLDYNKYITGTPTSASPTEDGSTILLDIISSNGYSLKDKSLTIFIKKRDLTITPNDNQIIFSDEEPAYQVKDGLLADQTACFTGSLQVENNVIISGTLELTDGEAENAFKANNYNLIVTSDVSVTVNSQSLAEAVKAKTLDNFATSYPDAVTENGWINTHKDMTVIAPTGYKIQPNQKQRVEDWKDSYTLTLDTDGEIPVSFQIKNETSSKIYERSFALKVDATAPAIGDVTTSDLTFSIPLSDATSGIASYIWQLNDGAEETVTLSGFPQNSIFTHTGKDGDNTLLLSITDQAGNILQTQTVHFTLKAPKDPDPIDPDPVDPPYVPEEPDEPDEPDVPEIPDEPVDPDVPVDPDLPDEPSDPTANEDIDNDIHIGLAGSTLEIQISYPSSCWIIDYNGRIICRKQLAVGMNRIDNLPAGAYILYFEGKKGSGNKSCRILVI